MSGIMLNIAGGTFSNIPAIGAAFGGGFFAGQINQSGTIYNLVIGPKASAQISNKQYKNSNSATLGADSVINGPQNTIDMVAAGSSIDYPAGYFCNDLVTGGFSDWYMPAKNELEVCYFNLKPETASNTTSSGINTNAVPSRSSNYTAGTPAQTSVLTFKTGGAEAFDSFSYWSSSESTDTSAWIQVFYTGTQIYVTKYNNNRVRAVRRLPA